MSITICLATLLAFIAQPQKPPAPTEGRAGEPRAGATEPTFEERLERVDRGMAAVNDLRADFEQRKQTSLLKRPLVTKGKLLSKGGSVLWETSQPRVTRMLVTDKQVKIFYPDDNLVEVYPMDARFREAAGGPLPRLAALRERFQILELDPTELKDAPNGAARLALRLQPIGDDLKQHITSVRVLIDERVPCADRIIFSSPDGDETEIRFSNVKINTNVGDSELDLRLPADVKVSEPVPPAPEANVTPPRVPPTPGEGKSEGK